MTLPSKYRIQGRARYLSVTETPHNIESLRVSWKEHFVSLQLGGQSGVRNQAASTTAPDIT